jgi:hypothetical protein
MKMIMKEEYVRILKEEVMVYFKVQSRHLPGGIKENYENFHSVRRAVWQLGFVPDTFLIQVFGRFRYTKLLSPVMDGSYVT